MKPGPVLERQPGSPTPDWAGLRVVAQLGAVVVATRGDAREREDSA